MAAWPRFQYTATDIDGQTLTIDLEYSTNGGGSWQAIASDLSNESTFAWTVPNTATTGGRVRVTADDGQATTQDQSDGNFTITTSSGGNELAVGSASGANGTEVTVPLDLSNDTVVKALQADIIMSNACSGPIRERGGFGTGARHVGGCPGGGNRCVRVVLHFENASTLAAGSGTVATLTYRLTGSQNSNTTLAPADIILSDPDANEIPATGVNGSLTVTTGPADAPAVQVAALKNPGRTRTVQVFVIVENGSGSAPSVTAGSTSVTMTDMGGGMYQGMVFRELERFECDHHGFRHQRSGHWFRLGHGVLLGRVRRCFVR